MSFDTEQKTEDALNSLRPENIKKDIVGHASSESIEQESAQAICLAEEAFTHLSGLQAFYTLRTKWSWFILGCISVLILFHIALTTLVGAGILDYTQYPWFLTAVVTEHLIQVIGLAIIVVKFLFSDQNKK